MNKQNRIITLLCIILFFTMMKNGNLNSKINDLEYKLNDMDAKLMDMESKLYEEEESNKLLNSIDFKIKSSNNENYISKLDVNINLNKLPQNSYPVFAYKESNSENWKEVELENNNALSYKTSIDLNQKKYYEYKVYTKGDVKESTPTEMISEEYYTGIITNWSSEASDTGGFSVEVDNPYSKKIPCIEDLSIKNIYVEVRSGSEIKKYELLKQKGIDSYILELKKNKLPKEYTSYLVAEYENGLIKKEEIHSTSY